MTAAGCVKAWEATTGGAAAAPPAASATSPVAKYVLTNVEDEATSAGSEAKPSTGTMTKSTGTMTKQYILVPEAGVNLAAHLNHKVRVTGKISPTMEHSAAPMTRPSDPAKPDQTPRTGMDRTGMDKGWSTLTVSSLTMVSATCPSATE